MTNMNKKMNKNIEKNKKQNIKEEILGMIQTGDIEMKSKAHFMLKTFGVIVGVLFAFGTLLYVVSFIMFALRVSGTLALPSFGLPGVFILFSSLPWILILVSGVLIIVVEVLGRYFAFVYRQPLLYSIITIIAIVGVIGMLVDTMDIHPRISRFAQERNILGGSALYRQYERPPFERSGIGVVIEITEAGYIIKTPRGESLLVSTSTETRFPNGVGGDGAIVVGDTIIIIGSKDVATQTITAKGIRLFNIDGEHFQRKIQKYKEHFNSQNEIK